MDVLEQVVVVGESYSTPNKGGNGGSGIVIIRCKTASEQGTPGFLKYDADTSSWITED